MKLVAAAIVGAVVLSASAAFAQSAVFTTGPGGAAVVVGERDHGWREREHGWREGRHYGWRRHHAECRTVVERHRRPNGTVVVRKFRSC